MGDAETYGWERRKEQEYTEQKHEFIWNAEKSVR